MNSNGNPRRAQVPPRNRQSTHGDTTRAPDRASVPPQMTTPEPPDPSKPERHWRKHPSDFHADYALGELYEAISEVDSARRSEHLAMAQVNATLSLRDAILEHAAVMRDIRDGRRKA